MRMLLIAVLVAAVAIPTVALAANAASPINPPDGGNDRALSNELRAMQHRVHVRQQRAAAKRRARAERRACARRRARASAQSRSTASPVLQSIAACESGGNPHAIGGGGAFRGKYQFNYVHVGLGRRQRRPRRGSRGRAGHARRDALRPYRGVQLAGLRQVAQSRSTALPGTMSSRLVSAQRTQALCPPS